MYSGSILQYSFSESGHEKGAMSLLVQGDRIVAQKVIIPPLRRMTVINDTLDNLLSSPDYERYRDDYVCLSIAGHGHHYEAQSKLRERYPHLLEVKMPELSGGSSDPSVVRRALDSPKELFSLFLDRFGWKDPEDRARGIELFEEARRRTERTHREVA
jgi:exonuclease SbcD